MWIFSSIHEIGYISLFVISFLVLALLLLLKTRQEASKLREKAERLEKSKEMLEFEKELIKFERDIYKEIMTS